MVVSLLQFFALLLAIDFGEAFTLTLTKNRMPPMHHVERRTTDNHPSRRTRLYSNNGRHKHSHANAKRFASAPKVPKRVPRNKRTAIRWVIQGVERALSQEGPGNSNGGSGGSSGRGGLSYKRRIDASLVDALYLMVNANSQKEVLDAEKRVRVLMKRPADFPKEVNERVIKATAMAGLSSLSLNLLNALLDHDSEGGGDLPSPMAYTAVLNALRKNGRVDRLERTLSDLASAARKKSQRTGEKVAVDVVAFNVHVAALCDAAVNESPFSSSSDLTMVVPQEGWDFNFTSLAAADDPPSSATASETSSSEKYLHKALNLLRGDAARTRFALAGDPDGYSHNSVLDAAAKCRERSDDDGVRDGARLVMASCLRAMKERGIRPDALTYNARIRAALADDYGGDEEAVELFEELTSDPGAEPDRYTICFMLPPFLRTGRREEARSLLREFYDKNVAGGGGKNNHKMVSSAFEAFLNTIVQETGEVNFACKMFRTYFLSPGSRKSNRIHLSQMIHVIGTDEPPRQQTDEGGKDTNAPSEPPRRYVEKSNRPAPRTRHFNILFSGFSKAHQSAISRLGKTHTSMAKRSSNDLAEDLSNDSIPDRPIDNTSRNTREAYELLGTMLSIGVPLDGFSVTSLMSLPSTTENITSLLKLIEPEMMVELNPAAYRSIITAYGRAGDPSSACWMFEEMIQSCRNQGRNAESWNVLLGALSKGNLAGNDIDVGEGIFLDIVNSSAARSRRKVLRQSTNGEKSANQVVSRINGKSCLGASMTILDTMRSGTMLPEGFSIPKPNSQSYCLVASTLSGYGTAEQPDSACAIDLFRNATGEGVPADGRFLNAVLRCFGDDVEGALAAWKSDIGPAAAARDRRGISRGRGGGTNVKLGTNTMAAYNGLMHVCGRAVRPDVATRIAYAMNKANIEPTEATLNSYFAGKRVALGSDDDESDDVSKKKKNLGLGNQYETLLSVECTRYNSKDKRQSADRKIRIIL